MAPSRRGPRFPPDDIPAALRRNVGTIRGEPRPFAEMAPGLQFSPIFSHRDSAVPANQETLPSFTELLHAVGLQETTKGFGRVAKTASASPSVTRTGRVKASKRSVRHVQSTMSPGPSWTNFGIAKPFRSTGLRSFPEGRRPGIRGSSSTKEIRIVVEILRHKMEFNCFKFHTHYAGSSVLWSPTKSFIRDDGSVDDVWLRYVTKEGLFRNEAFLKDYRRWQS